jgi:YesN/AraC family two-component response regulator
MDPVRLLIVDDAKDARFLLGVLLEDVEAVEIVGEAESAERALELIGECEPDVVLVDAVMPRVDGFELAPRLRERRPEARLVLISSHVDDVVLKRAGEAGFERVLNKADYDRVGEVVLEAAGLGRGEP